MEHVTAKDNSLRGRTNSSERPRRSVNVRTNRDIEAEVDAWGVGGGLKKHHPKRTLTSLTSAKQVKILWRVKV